VIKKFIAGIFLSFAAFLWFFISSPDYDMGVIKGKSMSPTINHGDLVVIKSSQIKIKPGVIIAYNVEGDYAENGELTLHRIVRIEGERLITKGDSDVEDDWLVTISDVRGVYLFRIPYLGYLVLIKEKLFHK
jgi:signal peptidase